MSAAIADALRLKRATIVEDSLRRETALKADIRPGAAPSDPEQALVTAQTSLDVLVEALQIDEPSLFLEYLAWAASASHGRRMPEGALPIALVALRDSMEEHLPRQAASAAAALLDRGIRSLGRTASVPASCLLGNPLVDVCRDYLDALLEGDRDRAVQRILAAVDGGLEIRELYMHVLQPVLHEVGRLWQLGEIGVAQEHFSTAATQLVMSMLYPRTRGAQRRGLRLVAACVAGERHEIGIRMVAEFFALQGWDTCYLGADTPTASILQAFESFRGDVLAVSATMVCNVDTVRVLVGDLRRTKAASRARVLVGGYPFGAAPQLCRELGADAAGADAEAAVIAAERLVERGGRS